MCSHVLLVDLRFRNPLLVASHSRQHAPRAWVDLPTTVADDADYDLLPCVLAPRLRAGPTAQIRNVLEHTAHGAREEYLVLVVHGDDNK